MKIKEIIAALERFAPLPLQDGFDNAGLQIGLTEAEATGALLCLDVTEEVVDEAIETGCNLIVSHHPLIFSPLRALEPGDPVAKKVIRLLRAGVSAMSFHTRLDAVEGGVNDVLAEARRHRLWSPSVSPMLTR